MYMVYALPPAGAPLTLAEIFAFRERPSTVGSHVEALKRAVSRRTGQRHVMLVSSGKAALTITLECMKRMRPGRNKVVIPALTSYSVPSAIAKAGLKIAPADIDPVTLGFDMSSLEDALSGDTLAVIMCHLYGYPMDIDPVRRLTAERDIFLIDDAAQAMGARYRGREVGACADAGIFSLGRGKNITTVNGGIITTDSGAISSELEKRPCRKPSSFDAAGFVMNALAMSLFSRPGFYGLVYRLPFLGLGSSHFSADFAVAGYSDARAAACARVMNRLDAINDHRKDVARRYEALLAGADGLATIRPVEGSDPVYVRFPVVFKGGHRVTDRRLGIIETYPRPVEDIPGVSPHLAPDRVACPQARMLSRAMVTLPTHQYVRESDGETIAARVSGRGN